MWVMGCPLRLVERRELENDQDEGNEGTNEQKRRSDSLRERSHE